MTLINSSASRHYLNNEASFRETLSKLTTASSLSVNSEGNLVPTGFFNDLFNGSVSTNRRLVEFKIMEFLVQGKKWLKPDDIKYIEQLASKVGLYMKKTDRGNRHKELRSLINLIVKEILQYKTVSPKDYTRLCQDFQTHYSRVLAPFSEQCEQIKNTFADVLKFQNENSRRISEKFVGEKIPTHGPSTINKEISSATPLITSPLAKNFCSEKMGATAQKVLGSIAAVGLASVLYYSLPNLRSLNIKILTTTDSPIDNSSFNYTGMAIMGLVALVVGGTLLNRKGSLDQLGSKMQDAKNLTGQAYLAGKTRASNLLNQMKIMAANSRFGIGVNSNINPTNQSQTSTTNQTVVTDETPDDQKNPKDSTLENHQKDSQGNESDENKLDVTDSQYIVFENAFKNDDEDQGEKEQLNQQFNQGGFFNLFYSYKNDQIKNEKETQQTSVTGNDQLASSALSSNKIIEDKKPVKINLNSNLKKIKESMLVLKDTDYDTIISITKDIQTTAQGFFEILKTTKTNKKIRESIEAVEDLARWLETLKRALNNNNALSSNNSKLEQLETNEKVWFARSRLCKVIDVIQAQECALQVRADALAILKTGHEEVSFFNEEYEKALKQIEILSQETAKSNYGPTFFDKFKFEIEEFYILNKISMMKDVEEKNVHDLLNINIPVEVDKKLYQAKSKLYAKEYKGWLKVIENNSDILEDIKKNINIYENINKTEIEKQHLDRKDKFTSSADSFKSIQIGKIKNNQDDESVSDSLSLSQTLDYSPRYNFQKRAKIEFNSNF